MRVSQSLLGMPSLLMMQVLLLVEWQLGRAGGAAVAWYIGLTLADASCLRAGAPRPGRTARAASPR